MKNLRVYQTHEISLCEECENNLFNSFFSHHEICHKLLKKNTHKTKYFLIPTTKCRRFFDKKKKQKTIAVG